MTNGDRWVGTEDLKPGYRFLTADNRPATVLGKRTFAGSKLVYNLTVDGLHTYFVGAAGRKAAAADVLVHNAEWCGPGPTTHFAAVEILDQNGNRRDWYALRSGNYSDAEEALGWPRSMIASHTENRVGRMSGGPSRIGKKQIVDDPHPNLMPVLPGETVIITGHLRPCSTCQGAMNRAAAATGANFVYTWVDEDSGDEQLWTNRRPKKRR